MSQRNALLQSAHGQKLLLVQSIKKMLILKYVS